MKNETIAVIYFDDTQIIGRIARVDGQAILPVNTLRKEYSGINNSHFADREDFVATFNAVLAEMVHGVKKVPPVLYIGVANEFCHVETQSSEIEFDRMTKVNRHHLQALWDHTNFNTDNRELIAKQALYFKLEEYDEVLIDVLGVATCGLEMVSCAVSVQQEFRSLIDVGLLRGLGFQDFALVAVAACELFMIPEKARDAGCTLVHSDFFSTSVANILGDGLTQLSHFNFGLGNLVEDIVDNLNVDYENAMQLIAKCTPTYEMLLDDCYQTTGGNHVPAGMLNDMVLKHVTEFANRLSNLETARVVYLSGGGFNTIYGAGNVLNNTCDRHFYRCRDALTEQVDYPETTLDAMIRYVLINR